MSITLSQLSGRHMVQRDMPAVLQIESESFEHPWDEKDFTKLFRQASTVRHVVELDDEIIGYVVYGLLPSRLHVWNLAVRLDHRRCGIGSTLLQRLKSKVVPSSRRKRITADVWEANLGAQLFFQRSGFVATEILSEGNDKMDWNEYRMVWRAEWLEADLC